MERDTVTRGALIGAREPYSAGAVRALAAPSRESCSAGDPLRRAPSRRALAPSYGAGALAALYRVLRSPAGDPSGTPRAPPATRTGAHGRAPPAYRDRAPPASPASLPPSVYRANGATGAGYSVPLDGALRAGEPSRPATGPGVPAGALIGARTGAGEPTAGGRFRREPSYLAGWRPIVAGSIERMYVRTATKRTCVRV